jgi:hypothetical protein
MLGALPVVARGAGVRWSPGDNGCRAPCGAPYGHASMQVGRRLVLGCSSGSRPDDSTALLRQPGEDGWETRALWGHASAGGEYGCSAFQHPANRRVSDAAGVAPSCSSFWNLCDNAIIVASDLKPVSIPHAYRRPARPGGRPMRPSPVARQAGGGRSAARGGGENMIVRHASVLRRRGHELRGAAQPRFRLRKHRGCG